MSQRERDLLQNAGADQAQAEDDDTPIVILPDGILLDGILLDDVEVAEATVGDSATEAASEPILEPAPVAAPPPPVPKPKPTAKPIARQASRVTRKHPASTPPVPGAEPLFSMEEIEGQIDDEITHDRAGDRRLFSMPWLCRVIAMAVVALLGIVLCVGREYYRLPLAARPLHYFHGLLRPSGTLGLSLGIIAALVMLMSLAYLVRKSLITFERLGSVQSWMGFHILTGLLGPAIALFHAAFVPTSALGLFAVAAMAIVVVSGIIGRYIAVYFPRSLEGREFKFEEIRGRLVVYRKKLAELGVDPTLLRIDEPKVKPRAVWLLPSIARVISGDYESRREYRRLKAIVQSKGELRIQTEMVLFLIKKLCWERQWLVRYGELRRLVGAWRFLHRWLAVVLFVTLLFHVVVGMRFGGLWILGGRK